MTTKRYDRQLVRRMVRGDESAFEEFSDRYLPALYRFALRRLRGDRELARELVQATVCQAIAKLASYRGEAALLTWLCACCRNEIAGHFRRNRHRAGEVELDENAPSGPGPRGESAPERELLRGEESELVHLALDALPPHYGRALEWKYIHELPVNEIAQRLRVGPKAAESLLTRARAAFRTRYRELTGVREPDAARFIGGRMGLES